MFYFLDACWEGTELSHPVRRSDNHRARRRKGGCVHFSVFITISNVKNLPRPQHSSIFRQGPGDQKQWCPNLIRVLTLIALLGRELAKYYQTIGFQTWLYTRLTGGLINTGACSILRDLDLIWYRVEPGHQDFKTPQVILMHSHLGDAVLETLSASSFQSRISVCNKRWRRSLWDLDPKVL